MLANQPTARPTNKALTMVAAFPFTLTQVAPAVNEIWPQIVAAVHEVWPQIAPSFLAGPAATNALAAIIAGAISLAIAWFVPDRANNPRH